MNGYAENPYQQGYENTEGYEGSQIGGPEYYEGSQDRRSENYGRSENYEGYRSDYKLYPDSVDDLNASNSQDNLNTMDAKSQREEALLRRRIARVENIKKNYESWDNENEWRPFTIMPRDWWRASPPSHSAPLIHPVNMVLLTYSNGNTCKDTYNCSRETKRIQKNHLLNGAVDVVFNFLIGGNGQVFEGRGWHSSPRLNHRLQRFSRSTLHIAFLGNLRAIMPSEKMFMAARDLMELGVRKQFISPKFLEYSTKLWAVPGSPSDSEVLKFLETW